MTGVFLNRTDTVQIVICLVVLTNIIVTCRAVEDGLGNGFKILSLEEHSKMANTNHASFRKGMDLTNLLRKKKTRQ